MRVWKNLSQIPESMDWLSLLKPWFPGNIILPCKFLKKGGKVSVFVSDGNMDEFCFLFFIVCIILPPKVFIWKRLFYRELIYSSHVGGDCPHCPLFAFVLIVTKK